MNPLPATNDHRQSFGLAHGHHRSVVQEILRTARRRPLTEDEVATMRYVMDAMSQPTTEVRPFNINVY